MIPVATARFFNLTLLRFTFALIMGWPALLNNGPFWFPDPSAYIREADANVYGVDIFQWCRENGNMKLQQIKQ